MIKCSAEKLADLEFYTEGPVVNRENDFFFTTLTGGKILKIAPGAGPSVWAEAACPNGQVIRDNGEHWLCESLEGRVTAFNADGSFKEVVVDRVCAGVPVSAPNDLISDSEGNLYFTDSVRTNGKVFFIGTDGRQKLIADGIDYANGLALNLSEDILYVAESYGNRILAFSLDSINGTTSRETLIDLPVHPSGDPVRNLPDGLALDAAGNIWVAHYGMQSIQVVSPGGVLLHTVDTGLPLTSNLVFLKDTPGQKEILVTGGYGEPGPGAVMLVTVDYF